MLEALERLDAITRRLRVECPWDREQDERTIVPHTVEEAYELADAAQRGDDAKLLDELGDVLFQVYFLSLLLEERGAGSLADVAERVTEKLIRRHPHVFGEAEASTAAEVLRNWDRIKQAEAGREQGLFGEVPDNLPAPLYARKVQRRAAATGFDFPDVEPVIDAAREELSELEAVSGRSGGHSDSARVSTGTELAALEGRNWNDLRPDEQLAYYARARLTEGGRDNT
jgi:MazG family protein